MKKTQLAAIYYVHLVSLIFILLAIWGIFDILPEILGEGRTLSLKTSFNRIHYVLIAVWLSPAAVIIWMKNRRIKSSLKWIMLSTFSLSILLPILLSFLLIQVANTINSTDEQITITTRNPDGTTKAVVRSVASLEKEERERLENYHHVNIVLHANGSIEQQGHDTISEEEYIHLLERHTRNEKMVTIVVEFEVLTKTFLDLIDLTKAHGIGNIRIINKDIMVEQDS